MIIVSNIKNGVSWGSLLFIISISVYLFVCVGYGYIGVRFIVV